MSYYSIKEQFDDKNDIHEILKESIMVRKKKYEDSDTLEMNTNKQVYSQQYILLDSFFKLKTSNITNGEYNWNLNTRGTSEAESIGIYESLDNIIEIQIGSFSLPILDDITYIDPVLLGYGTVNLIQNNSNSEINLAPTMVRKRGNIGQYPHALFTNLTDTYIMPWINNPYTQIPFHNHITIQLVEAGLQSFSNGNGTRFNFEYEALFNTRLGVNPSVIEAKPVNANGWDSFIFLNPIRHLGTISLIFRNPDTNIMFEPDVMYNSVISLTIDVLGGGAHITITTQTPHYLKGGDRVFLQNFIPMVDNTSQSNTEFPHYLTTYINRPSGHVVNSVFSVNPPVNPGESIPTAVSFGLDPSIKINNSTDVNISPSFPGLVNVYIAKRRLRIPMKIKYLKNKKE